MFSELFAKCDEAFKSADQNIRQNKKLLQQTRQVFPQPEQYLNQTHSYGNVASFPKSQRFKPIEKQDWKQTDLSFCESHQSECENVFNKTTKVFSFTRKQRFVEGGKTKKGKQQPATVLYPNCDATKKNNKQGPVIRQPVKRDLSKSGVSQVTAASLTEIGPGKYFIEQPDAKRLSAAFSKEKRFKKPKAKYEDNPLFIKESQTKKRPPSAAVMVKKIPKTAKLISKQKQEQMRERLKMVYWKSIPLQIDRLFKNKAGPILKEKYFDIKKLSGTQKRCAILMVLDRMNYQRGGFDANVETKMDKPCAVVYRKSTPKPFKFSEMQPGPDYYYPADDMTKPALIGFSFGREGQQQAKPVYDNRDYDIDEQIFKKGGNIIINPVHQEHRLTEQEIRSLNRGPGYYDSLFSQVEKRDDIGVVKFAQVTEKNARQNNCVEINKDVNDALYFPSYNAIDPNVPTPLLKEDANVKPAHLPDKMLFPEHWLFYDGDLNKVRAEIAKNVILAKNMDFNTYKRYTKRLNAFKDYLKSRNPMPEAGQYQVKYTELDPHLQGFDMSKKQQKNMNQPITKEQGQVDGDNLILNPKTFEDHLPNMDFGKTVGRPHLEDNKSPFDQPELGDRLILQPKKPQKKIADVKFDKMVARQDVTFDDENSPEGDVLILDPKPVEKHIQQVDFAKKAQKQDLEIPELQGMEEAIIINPKPLEKKIKGHVQMARMSNVRMIPLLRKTKNQKQEQTDN